MDAVIARRAWQRVEPLHAVTYFAPETRAATDALGLRGGWMSYFGCRAAPLGPVPAAVVTAVFHGFHPAMVARAIPDAWRAASPEQLLGARLIAVDAAYRRLLGDGDGVGGPQVRTAAALAVEAAAAADTSGRPLAAANAALPSPDEAHLALWQALTVLREHRGDGHVASLTTAGIKPCQAHVLAAAAGRSTREWLMRARGWDDAAWDAAAAELTERGWLEDGELSAEGLAMTAAVEADTDRLALGPWRALGDARCDRLGELLTPVRRAVVAAGDWATGNPIGVPDPV
jgi:hypothetical protein